MSIPTIGSRENILVKQGMLANLTMQKMQFKSVVHIQANRLLLCTLLLVGLLMLSAPNSQAQKVGFIASSVIRERWQDMMQAQQRIQSLVDDWKREAASMQKQIEDLEFEIKKNRLVWTNEERQDKENLLLKKKDEREAYIKKKFEPSGEYDEQAVKIMKPVEEKLFNAVQDVSASEGYDIVLDKSTQPIPYINLKYDLTVKVLKKLNIPADDLEEQQKKAIEEDPRNKKEKETSSTPKKRSRTGTSEETKPTPKPDAKPTDTPPPATPVEIPR
jgi:outer membrane protein